MRNEFTDVGGNRDAVLHMSRLSNGALWLGLGLGLYVRVGRFGAQSERRPQIWGTGDREVHAVGQQGKRLWSRTKNDNSTL